ncbi:GNAT family N-acetyltransferase [Paenibacillus sinopodophylli]|uniref:GNAT family N-acetyltransferase n=1 Tax=Paenibacillus sinopodophylli TaxID=1837342 RepID=UPI00110D1A37|nr:GNAT family N-acetyltransferase [Paenibacillus sinopodophylli]
MKNIFAAGQNDIDIVTRMAYTFWGYILKDETEEFKRFITEYSVRVDKVSYGYSYGYNDPEPVAFLLVAEPYDKEYSDIWYDECIKRFSNREQIIAQEYQEYFAENAKALTKHMQPGDLKISFLISSQRGCGSILLNHLEEICRREGGKALYLWTDTTCNHSYYDKKGFEKVEQCVHDLSDGEVLTTMIYRKIIHGV